MLGSRIIRLSLIGAAVPVCVVALSLAAVMTAVNLGHLSGPLVSYLERFTGRNITIAGSLRIDLFSLRPQVTAEGVTIGNPPWTPPGVTAKIDKLTAVFGLPTWRQPGRIEDLRLQGANLLLHRDAAGRANWQWRNPDTAKPPGLPLIRGLSAIDARVILDDQRRHLNFEGAISADDAKQPNGASALKIRGAGQLNGKPVTLELTGDPLLSASHDRPYQFSFTEESGESRMMARGYLSKPFDFDLLEARFEASGPDLKDLYALTGVSLVNTGHYRLSGNYSHRDTQTGFNNLQLITGGSDVKGEVTIESVSGRSWSQATLFAVDLRLADFGLRAAGRGIQPSPQVSLLLSNATLDADALRRGDAVIDFEARRLEIGHQTLRDFATKLVIKGGKMSAPLSAVILGGKVSGRINVDATQSNDAPEADVDVAITNLQLTQMPHKSAASPWEGAVAVRLKLTGRGSSVHQVAAAAEGSMTAMLSGGTVRTSLVELAGMDLRGLGLTLARSSRDTHVRCAALNFLAHAGVFTVQRMVLDTDPVLISGC